MQTHMRSMPPMPIAVKICFFIGEASSFDKRLERINPSQMICLNTNK
jgi:hypothetical protein